MNAWCKLTIHQIECLNPLIDDDFKTLITIGYQYGIQNNIVISERLFVSRNTFKNWLKGELLPYTRGRIAIRLIILKIIKNQVFKLNTHYKTV